MNFISLNLTLKLPNISKLCEYCCSVRAVQAIDEIHTDKVILHRLLLEMLTEQRKLT